MPGMITSQTCTCSVCGTTTEFPKTEHTYGLPEGPCDLDRRSSAMRQPMLDSYVQVCPCCGFASSEVLRETTVTMRWLLSEDYVSLEELTGEKSRRSAPVVFARWLRRLVRGPRADRPEGFPALAWDFYLAAKCYLANGDELWASLALRYAAWVCDDEGAEGLARMFRLRFIDLDEKDLCRCEEDDTYKHDSPDMLLMMRRSIIEDLRRAGELDRAAAKCSETKRLLSTMECDRALARVIAYEQDLIEKGDTGSHTIQEAVEAEATLRDIIDEIGKRIGS